MKGLDIDHFRERLLVDAFLEATSAYWLRRAATFDAARSRPGDHIGKSSPADIRLMDERLTSTANACRAHAALAPLQHDDLDDAVAAVLDQEAS